MNDQPWYILGAGALGCLWASYWRKMGREVFLICPSSREKSVLELANNTGKFQYSINILTTEQLMRKPVNIQQLLICTKAQHTVAAVKSIQQSINSKATVLVVQNGMAAQQLHSILPSQNLYFGITTDGAYRTDQLSVVHAGRGITHISRHPANIFNNTDHDSILEQLPTDDLNIQLCDDIEQRQWQKLAINCAINGLTAIHQCRNGELLTIPAAVVSMKSICQEISQLHQSSNTPLEHGDYLYQQIESALHVTANNYSSMYQDVKQGNSTEIDFINGYILEQARQQTISCPENERIVKAVKDLSHHDK